MKTINTIAVTIAITALAVSAQAKPQQAGLDLGGIIQNIRGLFQETRKECTAVKANGPEFPDAAVGQPIRFQAGRGSKIYVNGQLAEKLYIVQERGDASGALVRERSQESLNAELDRPNEAGQRTEILPEELVATDVFCK